MQSHHWFRTAFRCCGNLGGLKEIQQVCYSPLCGEELGECGRIVVSCYALIYAVAGMLWAMKDEVVGVVKPIAAQI